MLSMASGQRVVSVMGARFARNGSAGMSVPKLARQAWTSVVDKGRGDQAGINPSRSPSSVTWGNARSQVCTACRVATIRGLAQFAKWLREACQ